MRQRRPYTVAAAQRIVRLLVVAAMLRSPMRRAASIRRKANDWLRISSFSGKSIAPMAKRFDFPQDTIQSSARAARNRSLKPKS
jgi:hypothetical protein